MSEPPPPRYRVVERGRRLEVIDTWTGAPATRTPPAQPTPRAATPSALRTVAMLLCVGATDAKGRPLLTTIPAIDAQAPRTIALGPAGIRRVAGTTIGIAAATVALLVVAAIVWQGLFGAMLVAIVFGASKVQPVTTRWIDGLERIGGR